MVDSIEYEVPMWNQIYEMLFELSEKISKNGYSLDVIVGIARGGIIPTGILSDLLSVRQITMLQIEFYTNIAKPGMQPVITQFLNAAAAVAGKRVLVVDDISDSGQSLKTAKQYLIETCGAVEVKIATLYAKTATQVTPDFVGKTTDSWIVFPWEIKETLQSILQKHDCKKAANNEFVKLLNAGLPKELLEKVFKTLQEPKL
ncbi:MAG: phosphoribosyltransferase [Candidatus Bathyarchaeota archaeon]|nr:phosphoribosyltransferase [Candidatus Termiticorpusculum sp.]MCL1970079.1 phosphoribosyltransferase [Candidatus Termiticorpusculum sp.]